MTVVVLGVSATLVGIGLLAAVVRGRRAGYERYTAPFRDRVALFLGGLAGLYPLASIRDEPVGAVAGAVVFGVLVVTVAHEVRTRLSQ